ncbi:hypothetical protein BDR22DRAFT_151008 [Usnea florida]
MWLPTCRVILLPSNLIFANRSWKCFCSFHRIYTHNIQRYASCQYGQGHSRLSGHTVGTNGSFNLCRSGLCCGFICSGCDDDRTSCPAVEVSSRVSLGLCRLEYFIPFMFLHGEEHNRHTCLFLICPASPTLSLLAVGLTLTIISKAEGYVSNFARL